jgi:hypothetical protein
LAFEIKKAVRQQAKLRMALDGPPGSGKTWTALEIATGLGGNILLVETEGSSSSLYADSFNFDIICLGDLGDNAYHPMNFVNAIKQGEEAGYDVIIIDSLSHAWAGEGGALDLANKETVKSKSGNSFTAWRNVTPVHNKLINSILQSKSHIIATMRTKEKKVMEQDERGKTKIRTIGMEPIMREGVNYEFTIVGDMDWEHNLVITKTRCKFLDEAVIAKPGRELGEKLAAWLNMGEATISNTIVKEETTNNIIPLVKRADPAPAPPVGDNGGRSPEVTEFLNGPAFSWLKKRAFKGKEDEVIASTIEICKFKFQVEDLVDIPVEKLEELKTFIKTELIDSLRKDGLLK